MAGKMTFIAGLAVGYVLGSRAGRERYEQLVRAAKKVSSNPSVQEAAGMVQSQTSRLMSTGTEAMRGRLGNTRLGNSKFGQRLMGDRRDVLVDEPPTGAQPPSHF